MQRSVQWTILCLVLVGGACAPQHVEPPTVSANGYIISLQTAPDPIWIGTTTSIHPNTYLSFGEIVVLVQDAQGRGVNGVPVAFEVEPSWQGSVSLKPLQAITEDGRARAFIEPQAIGMVNVLVHVDNVTRKARFRVEMSSIHKSSGSSDMKGLPYPSPF